MRWHEVPFGPGEGRRILDIGCGSGAKLKTFERRGFEVFGIDVTPEAIADARRLVKGTFYAGAIETTELPDGFFDFIRFDNVLEHIYEPSPFLGKVYRLLKPGGTAYGYVPNGLSPTLQLMGKYSISSWVPLHINLFTPNCLRSLAAQVGFKADVVALSYCHWVMQSVRQWRFRNQPKYDETEFGWIDRFMRASAAPLWWLFSKVWQGEELVLMAYKPQGEAR
jgi:SAM-dependent methyltransferase